MADPFVKLNTSMIIDSYNNFVNGLRNSDGNYKDPNMKGINAEIQGLITQLQTDPSNMVAMLQLQAKLGTLSTMTSLDSNLVKLMTDMTKELARAIG